jgi:hypothetical protein
LWGLIEIALGILSAGRKRSIGEVYVLRGLKYFFLADVTFLFCIEGVSSSLIFTNQLILAGIILFTYFIGKFQNNQNKMLFFNMVGPGFPKQANTFNSRAELIVIAFALAIFFGFTLFPEYAKNPLSLWFYDSIVNIEDTPIFGFIFKVIAFFFLLNLFSKMTSGFAFIFSGQAFKQNTFEETPQDDDHFDDFTEIK